MSDSRNQQLSTIRSAAFAVEVRLRIGRAIGVLPLVFTGALGVTAGALAVRKAMPWRLSNLAAWEIIAGAGAFVVVSVAVAFLRKLPPKVGTVMLDRHHGLHGRLTNALAFEAETEKTPLMEVAIDDACEHAAQLKPGKAAPIAVPGDSLGTMAVAAGVVAVALLFVPPPLPPPPVAAKQIDAITMAPDDVELFRDAAKAWENREKSPEMQAAIERFNQLIEDIANKRLDRTEAFRKMEEIEHDLLKGAEADQKSFEEALKETADELKKSDLSKPAGEQLEKKDFEQAKKALKDLAQQFRDPPKGKKPDKATLDRLRQALQRAASRKKEALQALNEKRAEAREHLLKDKNKEKNPDGGAPSPEDQKLLKKKERELERLDREAEQKERAQRQLERLDRDLAKAAEDLMKDLGLSAQDLEQAAEDINRMQEEQMSEKEKEELRLRLEELRELLRQQGQGGKQRMSRMKKFGKRARGGGGGQKGQKGQGDKGQQGDDDSDDEGEGQGKDGEGKDGEGKDGEGQGGKKLVLGPGGKKIMLPGGSGGPKMPGGQGDQPGGGPGDQPGGEGQGHDQPGGAPGKGIGDSHDGNLAGKATNMKSGTTDVQEHGVDSQQGASNSQVILGAAEKGFRGTGYKKVFTKYHTVAEQEIGKDKIPDGYRFYVQRYFELIRPREEKP